MAITVIKKGAQSDPVLVKEQFEALQAALAAWGAAGFMMYFMWILTKTAVAGGTRYVPFKLNRIQEDLIDKLALQNLLLKARQMGGTTFMMLNRLLLPAVTQQGFRGLFVSQKMFYANQHFLILDRARRLFAMRTPGAGPAVNHLADSLNKHLLKRRLANRRELLFENLDSLVVVDSAESPEAGQGFCRHPDMWIWTPEGRCVRFGDLKPGDMVIGDDGTPVRVSNTFAIPAKTHAYKGGAVRLTLVGYKSFPEVCAPNHPFETQRGMVWAENLTTDDYIAFPHRKLLLKCTAVYMPASKQKAGAQPVGGAAVLPLDRELGFVCGFYLADGSVMGSKAISFPMMNPRKIAECEPRITKFFTEHFSGGKERIRDGRKRYMVYASSVFATWVRENLGAARYKHVPDWWADAPQEFLTGMMDGLFAGGGDWGVGKNSVVLTSVNSRIVLGSLQVIMALGWGVPGMSMERKPDRRVVICGTECNRRGERYKLSLYSECYDRFASATGRATLPIDISKRNPTTLYENGKYYVRVAKTGTGQVDAFYDITVDNDTHKYLCPIGITHNTINGFVGSEYSRWPRDPAETLANIRGSLAPGATLDLECTANGAQGSFYYLVNQALEHEGIYRLNFYEWWWTDEYRADPDMQAKELPGALDRKGLVADLKRIDRLVLTEKETALKQEELDDTQREEYLLRHRAHLDLQQVAWRRAQIRGNPKTFRENYPEDARTCFITEGNSFFNNEVMARRELELKNFTPYKLGRNGEAILFWQPRPNVEYLIGADVGEGMSANDSGTDLDYSAALVIERKTGEMVAQFRAHVRPDQYATDLAVLGRMYNSAEIAVERNSFGLAVLLYLETAENYPHIYHHPEIEQLTGDVGGKMGFPTNKSTRPIALSYLQQWAEENPNLVWSERFCTEALSFIRTPAGRAQAAKGAHDDTIAAGWIAFGARAYRLGFWLPVGSRSLGDDDY
jgi:hypothetical protein